MEKISEQTQSTKTDTNKWLDAFIETVSKEMKNGEVRLSGFGTFTSTKRAARNGVNPQTGKKIHIPACTVPKFRPAQDLKKKVS